MKIQEVKDIINILAESQWLYCRIKSQLDYQNKWIEFTWQVNQAGCKDALDVVLFIEQ